MLTCSQWSGSAPHAASNFEQTGQTITTEARGISSETVTEAQNQAVSEFEVLQHEIESLHEHMLSSITAMCSAIHYNV